MTVKKKNRLDLILIDKGLVSSRQRARAIIMAGKVLVDNEPIDKPGTMVSQERDIIIKGKDIPYVGRGGLKLDAAIKEFQIDVSGKLCLDVGASTGGFTDCLLQKNASRVIAVDVGYNQLAWKLRQDPRVVVMERTNIRYLDPVTIPNSVDMVTIDVSFISLRIVVPAILSFLKKNGIILALIKPQFEAGRRNVGKGGVVRSAAIHNEVIKRLKGFFLNKGLVFQSIINSPILGAKGNKEFFIYLKN